MNKFPNFRNKNVLILGLGLLGRGLKDAIFFAEKGANVTVTDLKNENELKNSLNELKNYKIKYTLGNHTEEDVLQSDLIIRNAGIPINSTYLKLAFKNNIPVEMDESFFAKYCPCPIIGITGTRGKTTTTLLIGEILKDNFPHKNIYVSGNLQGQATLPLIDKITKDDLVVLELSSWQLQGFAWNKISPHIAVFTNIYEDHLNSYPDMTTYIADKKNIFKFQKKTDYCIINQNNKYTASFEKEIPSKLIWFNDKNVPKKWNIKLTGQHNLENISAAIEVAKLLNLTEDQIKNSVEKFKGVEHRLEFVRQINKITFINDTTSTTPIAGQKALSTIKTSIILIAGGATKKIDLKDFAKDITKKTKAVVLLEGSATPELEEKIIKYGGQNLIVGKFDNFEKAIKHAYSISLPGDTVLLSPGCASFGMFANEFDRGDQFKKIVTQL